MNSDWSRLWPILVESFGQTLQMVSVALLTGGLAGLALGIALYVTRRGNLLDNRWVFGVLNVLVNIVRTVLVPEALAPLILGYTFLFIAVLDMSAIAGIIGGGGLGNFAIVYGYQRYNWGVVVVTVLVIIGIVQVAQLLGNWLARKALHR